MSIKVAAFDFDNCIVLDENTREGSEELKDHAWFVVFPDYKREILEPVIEEVKQSIVGGKGDRQDIVKRVLEYFNFPEDKIPYEVTRLCELFNASVQEGIKQINISPEVRVALAELSDRLPLYVNTATPREAVLESLEALKIAKFFKGVYGRPRTKVDNLRQILAVEAIRAEELLFVDDQPSGWKITQEIGCSFVGMHTARNKLWHNHLQPFPIIRSLIELVELLKIV